MSAPLLGEDWAQQLRDIKDLDWNSTSEAAIETIKRFATVPTNDGGIQFEIHKDGVDIEIVIDSAGVIESCLICREYKATNAPRDKLRDIQERIESGAMRIR